MAFSPFRKVFQGVADRREMFRMFDRHAQRPNRWSEDAGALYAGEWFEIGEAEHDYMLGILPPLWMKPEMFALREFLTGSVTSVFYFHPIDGTVRCFHGYCDLSDAQSPVRIRDAIVERESQPVKAMSRMERLEHIWSETSDDYRGCADDVWPESHRGKRKIVVYGGSNGPSAKLLDELTDCEISAKLPVPLAVSARTTGGVIDQRSPDLQARSLPERREPTASQAPYVRVNPAGPQGSLPPSHFSALLASPVAIRRMRWRA